MRLQSLLLKHRIRATSSGTLGVSLALTLDKFKLASETSHCSMTVGHCSHHYQTQQVRVNEVAMKSKTSKRHREKVQSDPMYGCRECPDFKADRLKHILHNGRANMSLQRHVMPNHPECAEKWKDFRVDAERRQRANRKTRAGERSIEDSVQNDTRAHGGGHSIHAKDPCFAQVAGLGPSMTFGPINSYASAAVGTTEYLSYLTQTRLWQEKLQLPCSGTSGWLQDTSYNMNVNAQPMTVESLRKTDQALSSSSGQITGYSQPSVYPDF